jgi:hypothetical protein
VDGAVPVTDTDTIKTAAGLPPETSERSPDWHARFIAHYGRPPQTPDANPQTRPLPYGHMAVTLSLKFNDSAPQVDHFDYHAGLGCPDFVLLIVPKQAKTEALARRALALVPELAVGSPDGNSCYEWEWKCEKWSGGHGCYLQSTSFELPEDLRGCATRTFGGEPVTHAFWEIEFTTNLREGEIVELFPHRNFRNFLPGNFAASKRSEDGLNGRISARVELNAAMNGVEIHFSRRPDDRALQPLRDDRRWRYTGFSRCWYARQTPEVIAWAHDFVARFNCVTGLGPVSATVPVVEPVDQLQPA